MGHFHFCHFLPLINGLNRLKPASGKNTSCRQKCQPCPDASKRFHHAARGPIHTVKRRDPSHCLRAQIMPKSPSCRKRPSHSVSEGPEDFVMEATCPLPMCLPFLCTLAGEALLAAGDASSAAIPTYVAPSAAVWGQCRLNFRSCWCHSIGG